MCHLQFGEFVGFVAGIFGVDQLCQQEVSELGPLREREREREIGRGGITLVVGDNEEWTLLQHTVRGREDRPLTDLNPRPPLVWITSR